jgi:hypothetical protein
MHIAFLTLFLGLTSGVQPFELSVSGPVASIEILLDGTVAQRLDGPPWTGSIDFGSGLAPHELVARALDTSGKEIARTRQWINMPRPPAEVEIALESPRTVRLSWERLTHEPPVETSLTLDGQALRLDGDRRASLPSYDPGSTHVLTAELRFPSNIVARKDLIFGGEAGETHTELTAVPIEVRQGRLPTVPGLQGWFVKDDGTPLQVAAIEEGPAELYLVRVPEADLIKARLRPNAIRPPSPLPLEKGDLLRIVSTHPKGFQGGETHSSLFDLSQHFPGQDGLRRYLIEGSFPHDNGPARPGDAVAVAGLHAMGGANRRAVVLVVDDSRDASLYDPAAVRRYLSAIRVPLFVWTLNEAAARRKAWGETAIIHDTVSLERAFHKVRTALERQRIVWIEGRHLPQSIRLSPKARGVAIAGVVDVPPSPPRQESPSLDLVPHELMVRAQGEGINLPALEIGLALEDNAVRVSWAGREPREVAVTFDGKPLKVKDGRAALPAYDPARVHLVAATLTFPREVEVRQTAALRDGSLRELTPVPARLEWGARLPALEELQGKLTARGEPLRVAAIERGPGELLVIRMPDREETRILLAPLLEKPEPEGMARSLLTLGKDYRVRLVSPRPQIDPAPAPQLGLFNLLTAPPRRDAGLLFNLTDWAIEEEDPLKEVRAADAVAVAGLQAAAVGHRRAVLLVLGGPFEDRSRLEPAAVRAYLASLGVPLYVWTLKDPFPAWEIPASQDLEVDLEQQRILWVEGRHLAREVRLAPEVADLELLAQ